MASGAALIYVKYNYFGKIKHITSLSKITNDDCMCIDASTIKNLVIAYIAIGNFKKAQKFCEILLLNNDNESEILNILNQIFKKNDKIIEFSKFISTIIEKKKIDIIYEIQKFPKPTQYYH